MELDIFEYVSKEEIRESILEGVRDKAMNLPEKDFKRIMTNAFYGTVSDIANDVFEERGFKEEMESKIKEIIAGLSSFNVFVDDDRFNTHKSKAQLLLDAVVLDQKELLKNRVIETFDSAYQEHAVSQDIAQIMSDHVYEIFNIEKRVEDE